MISPNSINSFSDFVTSVPSDYDDECCVCLEPIKQYSFCFHRYLTKGHHIHKRCALKMLNLRMLSSLSYKHKLEYRRVVTITCPICRQEEQIKIPFSQHVRCFMKWWLSCDLTIT